MAIESIIRPAAGGRDRGFLINMLALVMVDGTEFVPRVGWDALLPSCQAYFEDWGRPGDVAFIAEVRGAIPVGALWMRRPLHGGPPFLGLACLREARGEGIGTALIKASQGEARRRGTDLTLSVHVDNPAIRLYRRLGFREVGWFEQAQTGPMIKLAWVNTPGMERKGRGLLY